MSGHTPGPWTYEKNGNVYADDYKKTIVRINGPGASAEDEANARLIAAAPELLEALRELLSLVPMCEINDPTRWFAASRARAAIAAAEGK